MEDRKMTYREQEKTIRTITNYNKCNELLTEKIYDSLNEITQETFVKKERCERLASELLDEYPKLALSIIPEEEYKENTLFRHNKVVKNGN